MEIPLQMLSVNPLRARIYYNDEKTRQLIRSIRVFGIIEPLTVCYGTGGKYVIVSGERRYRAASLLGYKKLPCVLSSADLETSLFMALSNEISSSKLNYFETALCYEKLHDYFEITYEETAERLGLDVSEILSKVRLLQIPMKLRKQMIENGLSDRYAKILLNIPDREKEKLLDEIIGERLTLSEAKERAKGYLAREKPQTRKYLTFFKDMTVFVNTIEKAYDTMKAGGIESELEKTEEDDYVEYRIKIAK